jgi:hypothetical protein
LIWLGGGPSHQDMFDPKPDAPVEIRGEFGTINTVLPGVRIGELLPYQAGMLDKCAVIRSFARGDGSHADAGHRMMTGYRHSPS